MANTTNERRVISVIVMNESSVLARVTALFAGRGYNIESLTVAPIPDSDMSHITIATNGSAKVMEQITKQLHKLIPVYKVGIVNVGREMIIAMVADEPKRIKHFIEAAQRYNPCEVIRGGVVAIER